MPETQSAAPGARLVVYAALAANLLIAVGKFAVAFLSGSAAMWSEGVHSAVDSINEMLLLYGVHRSGQKPSRTHPLGYGREVYFWSFVVALLVLALGAGLSMYEGVSHLLKPEPIERPALAYGMLLFAALFEGVSWLFAMREFRSQKERKSYFEAFRLSKDPTVFTVLLEDTAALLGLIIALLGLTFAIYLQEPRIDAVASIGIAILLAATSTLLARETKSLLIGESASRQVCESITAIATADSGVRKVNGVITVQMGPHQVMAAMSAEFEDALTTSQIEACIKRIEGRIKDAREEVTTLFVKPQSPEIWRAAHPDLPTN